MGLLLTALALMLGVQAALPGQAPAQDNSMGGIGIFPVVIELPDALRGAEYLRTFTIINREATDLNLRFTPDGEISSWLTIHPSLEDLESTLEEVIVPAGTEARLILQVVVPEDTANGRYAGGVLFQGAAVAAKGDESGVGVSLGIAADITIDVTGEENMAGSVLDMAVDDAEVDQPPVRLRIQFQNDGNVQATPLVDWRIKDASGAEVGRVTYDDSITQPGFVQDLVVEWDPTGQPEGAYTAVVNVSLRDTVIDERELTFDLLPVGTLTRSGELDNLYLEGEPQADTVGKLVGAFRNTGEIDTRAVFTAEVYHGDQLIEVVESQERLVAVGKLALLEGFFDIGDAGDYRVRGKVVFEGKETETLNLEFSAVAPASNPDDSRANAIDAPVIVPTVERSPEGQSLFTWIVLGGVGLALVGGLAFLIGRRFAAHSVRQRSSAGD